MELNLLDFIKILLKNLRRFGYGWNLNFENWQKYAGCNPRFIITQQK